MDQLNIHKSESMVRLVARECRIPEKTLGKKGPNGYGHLRSMKTRMKFLEDKSPIPLW